MHVYHLTFLVILLIMEGLSLAEERKPIELDPVVVTASRIGEPLSEIPASVNVVTHEEMRGRQSLSVSEAVNLVPGLAIQTIGSQADPYTGITIRGANSNQSLLMIDGIKINSPFYQRAFAGPILLGNVDKIEVVKGSYSALYGSEAIGGVVNVITMDKPGLTYSLNGGTYRTSNAGVLYSNLHKDIAYTLGYETLNTEGFEFSGPFWNHNVMGKISLPVGTSSSLQFLTSYWDWKKFDNTICCEIDGSGNFALIIDQDSNTKERNWLNSVQLTHYLSDRWDYNLRISRYSTDSRNEDSIEPATPERPFPIELEQDIRSERDIFEMQHNFYPSERNIVTLGFQYTSEDVRMEEFSNLDSGGMGPSVGQPGLDSERISRAVYLQDIFKIPERFSFTVGARFENGHGFDSKLIPKVSALYVFPLTNTGFLISYGQGIRVPSLRELSQNADLNLTPEKSASMEAGLRQPLMDGRFRFEVTGFILRFKDLIDFGSDPLNPLVNIGRAKIKGAEASLKMDLTKKLHGNIGYTRLLTENSDTGEELDSRPHYRWAAEVRYYPVERLMIDLNAEFAGESFNPYDSLIGLDGQPLPGKMASYKIVNAAAAYNLVKGDPVFGTLDFTLKLSNIFDEEYSVLLDFRNAGYTFLAGIRATH